MPIKNLTDRESVTPRFRTLGKLRKGGEKTAKGYGPDLDHFRFTSDDAGIVDAFIEVYGEEPHALSVYLPHPATEQNFPTWKEAWTAGGLQHRCDGETCTIWLGQDGKYHRDPKPCPGGCDEVGRLEVIIPELIAAGYVGTVTMETHSLNDMVAITQVLLKTEELSGGDLRRVQFTLRRVPERISVPGWGANTGKRQRVEKWLVKIEPAVDWTQAQMALSRADERPALTDSHGAIEGDYTDPSDDSPFDESQLTTDIAHAGEVAAQAKVGAKIERPADAETVRGWLRKKAAWSNTERAEARCDGKKAQQVAALLGKAISWDGADEIELRKARLLTYQYIFGEEVQSSHDMTPKEAAAVIQWMGGGYEPTEPALSEARFLYHAAQIDAGQLEMFNEEAQA